VNDLTTNSNNNQQLTSFYLQSSPTDSNTFTFTLRPSQSLVSLVEPLSSPLPSPPPIPPRPSEQTKPYPSRVADIIHRFESHNKSSMNNNNNNQKRISPPTRSVFTKQWEENSSRIGPIVVVETPSTNLLLNSKKNTNKPKPIIIVERITNHDRPPKSLSTPPPVSPKSPLAKICLQNRITSQQNVESDTDSAIHTMAVVVNNDMNNSVTLSRSNTTDSTCSSSSSSSVPPPTPHFALPTIASTQKQRDLTTNSTTFKRTCSPPRSSVSTFTRPTPSTSSTNNENFDSSLSPRFCASEINLVDQYRRLSSPDVSRSDTNLTQNSPTKIWNTNLPLKYKRDSFLRLYG
jgi:hypothetical protein